MPPASLTQRQLKALALRLRQLTELRVQQRNQARLVEDQAVTASFAAVLEVVEAQPRSRMDRRPFAAGHRAAARSVLCAGHVQRPGGASPLCNLMEVKHERSARAEPRGTV